MSAAASPDQSASAVTDYWHCACIITIMIIIHLRTKCKILLRYRNEEK